MAFTADAESDTLPRPMKFPLAKFDDEKQGVLTGDEGRAAWDEISRQLPEPGEGTAVELDFAGVRAITVPFVEEFLVRLLSDWVTGYHEDLPLLLTNATEDVRRTVEVALTPRKLAILSTGTGMPRLLGGDQTLKETAGSVAQLDDAFTAAQLAEQLDLTVQAANNRLRSLMRSGVVARVQAAPSRGGREFHYRTAARR
ncbi:MAG TPA: hypothetical protein VMI34_23770 [Candidatus Bathyarchaeia archaeon]|nr:hypothetical protein [Candidatus Bathyarchaeia archaeon]